MTIDLGNDIQVSVIYRKGEIAAIAIEHPNAKDGSKCGAVAPFEPFFPSDKKEELWTLVSLDPLTVEPSLQCECGWHVHIRNGKVEPA